MEYVCTVRKIKLSLNAGENANHSCFNVTPTVSAVFKFQCNFNAIPVKFRALFFFPQDINTKP